jgi:hypothetical protein
MSKHKIPEALHKTLSEGVRKIRNDILAGSLTLAEKKLTGADGIFKQVRDIGGVIDQELLDQYNVLSRELAEAQQNANDGGNAPVKAADGGGQAAPVPQVVAPMPQVAAPVQQAQMAEVELHPAAAGPQQRDYDAYQQQNASGDQQGYVALGGDEKSVCPCVIL